MLLIYNKKEQQIVNNAIFIYDEKSIEITVKDIPYDPKEDDKNYYIKFNLIDFDGDFEGVWGLVSLMNYYKYNSSVNEYITVVLANNTLAGLSWGSVFPLKLEGNQRPYFDMRLVSPNQIMYKALNDENK